MTTNLEPRHIMDAPCYSCGAQWVQECNGSMVMSHKPGCAYVDGDLDNLPEHLTNSDLILLSMRHRRNPRVTDEYRGKGNTALYLDGRYLGTYWIS